MADEQTIQRAQAGDVAAFGQLFQEYQGRIYGLALRMVADPARAEDMTQETFVRAWRKLDRFAGRSTFYTWLHRLAVNVVLNELRRRRREPTASAQAAEADRPDAALVATPGSGPATAIDLERAIVELPRQARMVFWLHDIEGYAHREIAEAMGIAEGTSKAHLHRARLRLREALTR